MTGFETYLYFILYLCFAKDHDNKFVKETNLTTPKRSTISKSLIFQRDVRLVNIDILNHKPLAINAETTEA